MSQFNNTGICSIVVEGETIPLRFGMPANRIIFQKFKEHPEWVTGTIIDERSVVWLLYAGYINACMAKDQEPVKRFEFFFDLTENMAVDNPDQLQDITDVYINSRFTTKALQQLNVDSEAIKKKMDELTMTELTGTPLSPSATENLASVPTSIES